MRSIDGGDAYHPSGVGVGGELNVATYCSQGYEKLAKDMTRVIITSSLQRLGATEAEGSETGMLCCRHGFPHLWWARYRGTVTV